jgi:hypothetical protein
MSNGRFGYRGILFLHDLATGRDCFGLGLAAGEYYFGMIDRLPCDMFLV